MDPNSHFSAGKFMDIILMRRSALYNPSIFNIFYRFLFSRIRIWIRFDFLSLRASGSGLSMKSRLEQAIDCAEKLKWDANHTKYMNIIQYSQTKKNQTSLHVFRIEPLTSNSEKEYYGFIPQWVSPIFGSFDFDSYRSFKLIQIQFAANIKCIVPRMNHFHFRLFQRWIWAESRKNW